MSCIKTIARKIRSNSDGLAATEFGLIAVPFSVLLMGAFDLGYKNYVRSVMPGNIDRGRTYRVDREPRCRGRPGR